jgi:3-hydroxyisobutyrate dehydrogenase
MTRVGFAGLGRMGAHMAANLAEAGFDTYVWNRSAGKAARLSHEIGAIPCPSPKELAESTDVVMTMLSDDNASERVHCGTDGLFAARRGAEHFIEMGTHSPRLIRDLVERASGRGVVDAPVSGSVDAARDASLLIMAGTTRAGATPFASALEAMSRRVVYLGSVGSGAAMKLAVNLLIHSLNQSVAESLVLAEAAGIDVRDAYEVLENSAAAAPMLTYRKQQYLDEDSAPISFALGLARKDVALALDLAEEEGVQLPQARVNLLQLSAAESGGFSERDMAAMFAFVKENA